MDEMARRLADATADHYRIERELGAGGMARVFLAQDLRHGREVAIKVLRPELAQSLGAERFVREIRLLARLQHPNILGLVDSGGSDGMLYYVMPYLAGGSLRARLDRERELPVADAVRILREIAGGLDHAHTQGVVHRDIKPENVLFSAGHALVADFGIARVVGAVDPRAGLTGSGIAIGTPKYMAPEQAAGDPQTDHRADLYAFGALAYETLAGVPPFSAASAVELAGLHMAETPTPLGKRRPAIPRRLEEIVMRCLEKRPADRWQSAGELVAALDEAATTESGPARRSRVAGTVTARMPITESIARRIDRRRFDPRMIGDTMEYLDNHAESDVLVLLMNAIWLDGTDLEPHLRMLPYRCIAPTLYGFDVRARHRFGLSLDDHIALVSALLEAIVAECRPRIVVLMGFSASGDLVLKLPLATREGGRVPDGVLALGPNQGIETCFISRVLAQLESTDPDQLLASMRAISETASSLDDWMLLNGYLGRIMSRFRADVRPLNTLARDIVAPFERDGPAAFSAMYRDATGRVRSVRCVFEDSQICNRLLRDALTDHMDRRTLGERHRDGSLLIEPTPSHHDLLQVDRVAAHLAAMVSELRATAG